MKYQQMDCHETLYFLVLNQHAAFLSGTNTYTKSKNTEYYFKLKEREKENKEIK